MAARNNPRGELVAIYRLEFYKKQKKWKLATDARKEKAENCSSIKTPTTCTKISNETYTIDTKADEVGCTLNDAFLTDESEKSPPIVPTCRTRLVTQMLEPINACEECQLADIETQHPWAEYVDEGWHHDSELGEPNDWRDQGYVDKCGEDNEFPDLYAGWVDGMVWTKSGHPQTGIGDSPTGMNILLNAECREHLLWAADNLLDTQFTSWSHDKPGTPEIWRDDNILYDSLEDVEQFLVGAHSAPHSSELDLRAAAGRRAAGGARAAARRPTLQNAPFSDTYGAELSEPPPRILRSTDYSYEVFPTRDVGFDPVTPPAPGARSAVSGVRLSADAFVAGSHVAGGARAGRGRGRLPARAAVARALPP